MTDTTRPVPTQPEPAGVAAARRGLAALLRAPLSIDDELAATEALSVMSDVAPPYPPMATPVATPFGVDALFAEVQGSLSAAVAAASTVEEALRCSQAARILLDRPLDVTTPEFGDADGSTRQP